MIKIYKNINTILSIMSIYTIRLKMYYIIVPREQREVKNMANTTFTANVKDANETSKLIENAIIRSESDIMLIMSNGSEAILTHNDYEAEYIADGYWTAMIFENGHKIDF